MASTGVNRNMVVLLLSFVSVVAAMKCFRCINCGLCIGVPYECPPTLDACLEANVDGRVDRSCVMSAACKAQSGFIEVKNRVIHLLTGSIGSKKRLFRCCKDDYCNGPSHNYTDYHVASSPSYCCNKAGITWEGHRSAAHTFAPSAGTLAPSLIATTLILLLQL